MLAEWNLTNRIIDSSSPTTQNDSILSQGWRKPTFGFVKVNVDAAFDYCNHNRTGIGMCIRSDQGTFISADTIPYVLDLLPHEGEALGVFLAFRWVHKVWRLSLIIS